MYSNIIIIPLLLLVYCHYWCDLKGLPYIFVPHFTLHLFCIMLKISKFAYTEILFSKLFWTKLSWYFSFIQKTTIPKCLLGFHYWEKIVICWEILFFCVVLFLLNMAFPCVSSFDPFLHNATFWLPWKHKKTFGFLILSGGRKVTLGRCGLNVVSQP